MFLCPTNEQLDPEDCSVLGLIFCKILVLICSILKSPVMSACLSFCDSSSCWCYTNSEGVQNGNILLLAFLFYWWIHLSEHFYRYMLSLIYYLVTWWYHSRRKSWINDSIPSSINFHKNNWFPIILQRGSIFFNYHYEVMDLKLFDGLGSLGCSVG